MFLKRYPEFEERPATITEFLGPTYLDVEGGIRAGLKAALVDIFGEDVDPYRISVKRRAMFTGGIGIGKTTLASIAIPYMVHWLLCLKQPQVYFNMLPGTRIAFMQMSTSDSQAKEVLFGDIKARIEFSRWFQDMGYLPDPNYKNQLRFSKNIWVLPGNSSETTFEGYNIMGGILDEMDSHKVTLQKDYAELGYDTIHNRIVSRFKDRGLLIAIGQMKKSIGFASTKYAELAEDPDAKVIRMTIWESFGWQDYLKPDGTHDSFWYDHHRKAVIPASVADLVDNKNHLIEVPNEYSNNFRNDPEKALRDLAGIPPAVGDPFISLVDRIESCRDKWISRHEGLESPVGESPTAVSFAKWFYATDTLKRVVHIDLAYSANGDALGLAMAHVSEVVEIDDERKPYIVIDCLARIRASAGNEIMLSDVRRLIYHLKDDLGFKIKKVTMDGFESTDTLQQLAKRRYETENVSMDKSVLPYHDLREAIYEGRLEFPPYVTHLHPGDTKTVEIAVQELMQLTDTGKKIDHPENGSKDVADAMAGCCYTLMGDRRYRRGVSSIGSARSLREKALTGTDNAQAPPTIGFGTGTGAMSAPLPPSSLMGGLSIPSMPRPPKIGP